MKVFSANRLDVYHHRLRLIVYDDIYERRCAARFNFLGGDAARHAFFMRFSWSMVVRSDGQREQKPAHATKMEFSHRKPITLPAWLVYLVIWS